MVPLALAVLAALPQVVDPGLDHRPVGCAVPERFVRLEARPAAGRTVGSARIYFRAAGQTDWYWVSMHGEAGVLSGVLPKPTRALEAFDYYIDVIDLHLASARTPEVAVRVAPGCDEMGPLLGVATTPIVVGVASAGVPLVPVGFSPVSVVSAAATAGTTTGTTAAATSAQDPPAGGRSTMALVAGGIVVGGLAVAAIAGGDSQPATPPSPPAAACPAPAGTGPVRSQSFAWTLPGGTAFVAQRFELPFPVTGAGTVEARTSYASNARVCACVGTSSLCRQACAAGETITITVQVCEIPELTAGQWWFQVYCQQDAGVCVTPLPAGGVAGTTSVTYTPR